MKSEIISGKILIRVWAGILSMILASFFAKQCSLVEISRYLTLINVFIYLATAIYGFISFVLASNNKLPGICATIPMVAIIIMISMGSMEIIWLLKGNDQNLIKWWDILQEMLNTLFAVYIMTTMYIINNFERINEKYTICQIKQLHKQPNDFDRK